MASHDDALRVSPRRVLFVDDDDLMRSTFARAIGRLGYEVDTASSAGDAVAQAQARAYPVVVTDLRMPGVDGLALIEQLCGIRPATAFVLVTADTTPELRWNERIDGAIAAVVRKPLNVDDLAQSLDDAFEFQRKRAATLNPLRRNIPRETTVLLVEDNPADADLICDMLAGHRVVVAQQLSDALRCVHDGHFESIITDLTLPDARGLDAVMRLQASAPEASIVVMSGLDDDGLAQQVIQLGAQDYLVKDGLTRRTLLRVLNCAIERKRAEQRLVQLAHYDQLTGLLNRASFYEQLTRAVTRARRQHQRMAVMLLDVDGFKAVNDTFGHDAGDGLLQELSHRMRQVFREYDLIARLGGDEFAIALTELEGTGSVPTVAQRVLNALATPVELTSHRISVSASIGISVFPDSAESIADLLKRADLAMYEAKGLGKNTFCSAGLSEPPPRISSWPAPPSDVREMLLSERVAPLARFKHNG
jgi:diguanylate cyclase (GGDEF)-like protein